VIRSRTLALDIDVPGDLKALRTGPDRDRYAA